MALVTLPKTGDPKVDKALVAVEAALKKLDHPLGDGVFVDGDITAGTPTRFVHNLKRPFKGWFVVRTNSGGPPFEDNVSETDKHHELWLNASSDASITVYIF